ncbi:MAG: hypothetical protein CMC76_12210 [Flavobacteriaceae bacterium]|nr:hypothetical protein [Flavobacteriaceae bacterium]|tara:strand:+ start:6650 stop:7006 length:357 start_codon:yes stop_codon:yes gene_type:complete
MDITGKLHSVGETKTFDSGFQVQEFYLDLTRFNQMTGEKYSNHARFKIFNEKCNPDQYKVGDIIKVGFSINGKSFAKDDGSVGFAQDLVAYKIDFVREGINQPESQEPIEEDHDDLPF